MAKKKFVYDIVSSRTRKVGGRVQTAKIYEVKNNTPRYIGETKWNTAGYKGDTSEVYTKLKSLNKVSKKDYDKDDGYYTRDSKIEITKL